MEDEDSGRKKKSDRSRSDRRRRGKMKEDLYALRSLVPYMSKMDKASIAGDAASYLQELQTQAENLKAEIASIRRSLVYEDAYSFAEMRAADLYPSLLTHKIYKMDVVQLDKREYCAQLVSSNGQGAATSIFKALHTLSLAGFDIPSFHMAVSQRNYFLTFPFIVTMDDEGDWKLWIASVLLMEGFEFDV
ncbi:hypothetical protein M569_04455 [Genlisea aurea]|uniref:BHLH domain-containing protein n=1 Tax=Genlisea aurea TaxID=192259 RepID=S8CSM5_9LAMI|nr:hypothetical protein M569_04455 [Genlisea aurea]